MRMAGSPCMLTQSPLTRDLRQAQRLSCSLQPVRHFCGRQGNGVVNSLG